MKIKYLIKTTIVHFTMLTTLFLPSWALASNSITNGANSYLVTKTWAPNERYNATHFLMVLNRPGFLGDLTF